MMPASRRLIPIFFALAFVVWVAVAWRVMALWGAPLGAGLALPSYTPTRPGLVSATPPQVTGAAMPPATTPRPSSQPTNTLIPGRATLTPYGQTAIPQPVCGGPPVMNILLVGSDTRAEGYLYGLSDVIRVARVDFSLARVTILDFPRDLWVEIPEIKAHYNLTKGKLNQSYLYGNPGMGYYEGAGAGPGLLARTLDLNFGARPEHYIAINMHTFVRLVDALGGINITLPYNVDGRVGDQFPRWDLYFRAGPHHLTGAQALTLARLRIGNNTDRSANQNIILCGLRDALLNPSNVGNLPGIIDAFDGAVQTDLSPAQISQLACLSTYIQPQNIIFAGFPPELLTGARTYDKMVSKDVFIWQADFEILRQYVRAFNEGSWPGQPPLVIQPGGTPPPSQAPVFSCP